MSKNYHILNRIFTKQALKNYINKNQSLLDGTVLQYLDESKVANNLQKIKSIYNYMSKNYRNEYFYQNTIFNKLLLGKHSLNTTTALTQLHIEKSIADFVMINGKAVVYEIKTELDNFDRLGSQIEDYYKAFKFVTVFTDEKMLAKVEPVISNPYVGIYVLTPRNTIKQVKQPSDNSSVLTHESIFKILRKKEYESIIWGYFGNLPQTTPVFYYDKCLEMFQQIPMEQLYSMFLSKLKSRTQLNRKIKFENIPYELKSIAYFINLNYNEYVELNHFLNA